MHHYRAATGELEQLRLTTYPLGMRPRTQYRTIELALEPGNRVVLCSDGIVETANADEETFV